MEIEHDVRRRWYSLLITLPPAAFAPMRYALHKLLVMAERQVQFQMKIRKDAGQVAALVEYGIARSPRALADAAEDIMSRGPGWRSRVKNGLKHLVAHHPAVASDLAPILKSKLSAGMRRSRGGAESRKR